MVYCLRVGMYFWQQQGAAAAMRQTARHCCCLTKWYCCLLKLYCCRYKELVEDEEHEKLDRVSTDGTVLAAAPRAV
jgi:hypothetical protein